MSWLKRLLGEGFILEFWKGGSRGEYSCLAAKEKGPSLRGVGPTPREAALRAVKNWREHEDSE